MDKENAAAVYKALKEFGAPLAGMSEADFIEGHERQRGHPPQAPLVAPRSTLKQG